MQRIVRGYSRENRKANAEIAEYRRNQSEEDYAFKPAAKKNRSVYGQQESKGIKKAAARERLPLIKMWRQTFCAPLGALPASRQFTGGFD